MSPGQIASPQVPPLRRLAAGPCVILLLVALALTAFFRVYDCGFINYDDAAYVYRNPRVLTGLNPSNFAWAWTTTLGGNYNPLTWISLQLDAQCFGPGPRGFHLTNLVLHILNGVLLFLALRAMTGSLWRAALVAACFAVHPLRVESVAWVSERKDVLSTAFGLLALLAYVHYARRPRWSAYLLVALLLTLSLLAKPMWVTMPFLLLLLDFWPLRRIEHSGQVGSASFRPPHRLILEKIPLLILVAACSVVTMFAQAQSNAVSTLDELSLARRLSDMSLAYVGYLAKFLWPVDLGILYPLGKYAPSVWAVAGAAGLLLFITAFSLRQINRRPWLAVGWLWYLGTLVPVIGLVQVGAQGIADRYTYLPTIGLVIMVVWSIPARWSTLQAPRLGLAAAAFLLLACLSASTWAQIGYWRDSTRLWEHTIQVTTPNPAAYTYYANALSDQGHLAAAIPWYERALTLNPGYQLARKGMAIAFEQQPNSLPQAIEAYQMMLRANPDDPLPHLNLGVALARLGRHQEAAEHLTLAVKFAPQSADAHFDLGVELVQLGQPKPAAQQFEAALAIDPGKAQARLHLGHALAATGQWSQAIMQYEKALTLQPDMAEAHNSLGIALARTGQTAQAIDQFRLALRFRPNYDDARNNLQRALSLPK